MTYPLTTGDLVSAADWNALHHAIETISLGTGTTASFTSPVPTGFRHLHVVANGGLNAGGDIGVRLNGVASGYEFVMRTFADAAANDTEESSVSFSRIPVARWNNVLSCHAWFTISDYNDTSNQTVVAGGGIRSHPSAVANMGRAVSGGRHPNTDAITSVTLTALTASAAFAGGEATLYGIP